ncbi:McrB family protein [Pseudomonas akapageensis]|uniref:McrB family protein n=1 Tax=Pseudomonas akapageensis TaxID=2609961 RepID=UPI001C498082|nr:AAA family ATPase [Pseudomonas akapageensis]
MNEQRPAWLLTWNPRHFSDGGDGDECNQLNLMPGSVRAWSCSSHQPQEGETVYLVRLGLPPRGIIAKGTVARVSYEGTDWKDTSKLRRYIDFRVDEYRPDCASGLLPMVLLEKALPLQRWSPQASGISIGSEMLAILDGLWQRGSSKHSLWQYVDWSSQDEQERCPEWLGEYQDVIELGRQLRDGAAVLDEPALIHLWRDKANGVASVGLGFLSHQSFADNQPLLRKLTEKILVTPDAATLVAILAKWREAVNDNLFDSMRPAAIKRVFAAFAPETFTTLLNDDDCRALLAGLKEHFQLPVECGDDWAERNRGIKSCMAAAGLEARQLLENNIAMWQLLVALKGKPLVIDAQNEQGEACMESHKMSQAPVAPLNQIFFGPPGTGKTFATIDAALAILDPENLQANASNRNRLKQRFDELVTSGQIVFCTFHQSFSYEDFVQGIRAETVAGQLQYSVHDGVFKQLCDRARSGIAESNDVFDQALARFKQAVADAEDEGGLLLQTIKGKTFRVECSGGSSLLAFPTSAVDQKHDYFVLLKDVRRLYEGIDKKSITNNPSYVWGVLEYLQKECGLPPYEAKGVEKQPAENFVLIIDEINRGNVSRIFGELITLIEPSKREGADEALAVTLPYDNEGECFSVPSNLYLIGTMNTADRSLASLDIALRRRFTFREMPPQPELLDGVDVAGVDIGQLLRMLNQRIEVLLDRDHCLGHAYFMPLVKDPRLQRLELIFRNQVLPLLQEYFFEDWQRIQWVLNDHRKAPVDRFVFQHQRNVQALFGDGVDVSTHNLPWSINDAAFQRVSAYAGIIAVQVKEAAPSIELEPEEA